MSLHIVTLIGNCLLDLTMVQNDLMCVNYVQGTLVSDAHTSEHSVISLLCRKQASSCAVSLGNAQSASRGYDSRKLPDVQCM